MKGSSIRMEEEAALIEVDIAIALGRRQNSQLFQ